MTPEPGIVTEHEFWEHYKPIPAPLGTGDGGNLWNWEQAQHIPLNQVWTVVEGDDDTESWYACPGFHIVNKIGYCITQQPWVDETKSAYYYFDDRDRYDFLLSNGEIESGFGEDERDARERVEAWLDPGVTIVRRATNEEAAEA